MAAQYEVLPYRDHVNKPFQFSHVSVPVDIRRDLYFTSRFTPSSSIFTLNLSLRYVSFHTIFLIINCLYQCFLNSGKYETCIPGVQNWFDICPHELTFATTMPSP